jgi:glyoxylase-like metal-dependent hydrolase (beta-lactamase superfamily II)
MCGNGRVAEVLSASNSFPYGSAPHHKRCRPAAAIARAQYARLRIYVLESASFPPTAISGTVRDGHRFDLGGRVLEVIDGPGHSPGGISLLDAAHGALFSADVAYAGALYVYDPADLPVYLASLRRLAELAPDLRAVYPAHDDPTVLARIARGVADVIDGREPSSREGDMARYDFDGFAVQVWGMPEPVAG